MELAAADPQDDVLVPTDSLFKRLLKFSAQPPALASSSSLALYWRAEL